MGVLEAPKWGIVSKPLSDRGSDRGLDTIPTLWTLEKLRKPILGSFPSQIGVLEAPSWGIVSKPLSEPLSDRGSDRGLDTIPTLWRGAALQKFRKPILGNGGFGGTKVGNRIQTPIRTPIR